MAARAANATTRLSISSNHGCRRRPSVFDLRLCVFLLDVYECCSLEARRGDGETSSGSALATGFLGTRKGELDCDSSIVMERDCRAKGSCCTCNHRHLDGATIFRGQISRKALTGAGGKAELTWHSGGVDMHKCKVDSSGMRWESTIRKYHSHGVPFGLKILACS
jgi:hypothetical protein